MSISLVNPVSNGYNKEAKKVIPFKASTIQLTNNDAFVQVYDSFDKFENRFGLVRDEKSSSKMIGATMDDLATDMAKRVNGLSDSMEAIVFNDGMLGCLNARAYNRDRVKFFLDANEKNTSLGVISFDIDNFGNYNNSYGHIKGDEALKSFVNIVEEVISSQKDCHFYRKGGEEFTILLSDKSNSEIDLLANTIKNEVKKRTYKLAEQNSLPALFTVSCGYSNYIPDPEQSTKILETNRKRIQGDLAAKKEFKELFDSTFVRMEKEADDALYISKINKGRDSVTSQEELKDPKINLLLQIGRNLASQLRKFSSDLTTKIMGSIQVEDIQNATGEFKENLQSSLAGLLCNNSENLAKTIVRSIDLPPLQSNRSV